MMKRLLTLVVLLVPVVAIACPVCSSPAGRSVRRVFFMNGWLQVALLTILPFLLVLGFIYLLSRFSIKN